MFKGKQRVTFKGMKNTLWPQKLVFFTAEIYFWHFSVLRSQNAAACLITRTPHHLPPSFHPIPSELHQSKRSSRIANASDGSASPNNPEVEEFSLQQAKVIFFLHSVSCFLPHFPSKCFSLIIRAYSSNWSSTSSPIRAKPVISGYYLL